VTKSWPAIIRKLQKAENWEEKSLEELLKEAQNVYEMTREKKTTKS
jgi:hypothetical protein